MRRVAAILLLCLVFLGVPGSAEAAESGGLQVAFTAVDPLQAAAHLTNTSKEPCQVSRSGLGTIVLSAVEQGGQRVAGISGVAAFTDDLALDLQATLTTVAPGQTVDVPLHLLTWHDADLALETVQWSAGGGAVAWYYPVKTGQPVTLQGAYTAPDLKVTGAPLCLPGAAAPIGAKAVSGGTEIPWLLIGVGIVVFALLGVVVVLILRRRSGSAAIVLILLAGAGLSIVDARPALATLLPSAELAGEVARCKTMFAAHDPAGIMPTLNDPTVRIFILKPLPTDTNRSHTGGSGKTSFVQWDPADKHKYVGKGDSSDPCWSLYHELFHAYEITKGKLSYFQCVTAEEGETGLSIAEVNATKAQNKLLKELGKEQRDHYGEKLLPKGECMPPPEPGCADPRRTKEFRPESGFWPGLPRRLDFAGEACATSFGDPHLLSFSGKPFDFQGAGEFVLAKDDSGAFEVQIRQEPVGSGRLVSVNTSVAMRVGPDTVELRADGERGTILYVNGVVRAAKTEKLPGGGDFVVGFGQERYVIWPDFSMVGVDTYRGHELSVQVVAGVGYAKQGLLGNPPASSEYDKLYPGYADSMRITARSSLFTYDPALNTDSYTDKTYPDRKPPSVSDAARDGAATVCAAYGVTKPSALAACILDVSLTGRPEFAAAAATVGQVSPVLTGGTSSTTVHIGQPGDVAKVEFDGKQGQKVFIDFSSNLPAQCTPYRLRDPDGSQVNSGCTDPNGSSDLSNYIDGVVLPKDGKYSIVIDPNDTPADIGDVTVTVHLIQDVTGTMTVGGPAAAVSIAQPGVTATLTFPGKAGQLVKLDVTDATLPDECNVLKVYAPDRQLVKQLCVSSGKGSLITDPLPADGLYTIVVDPSGHRTGKLTLHLTS